MPNKSREEKQCKSNTNVWIGAYERARGFYGITMFNPFGNMTWKEFLDI